MGNFIDLLRNENMKIYDRLRTWIMLGILLVLMLASSVVVAFLDVEVKSMWEVFELQSMFGLSLAVIFTVVVSADSVAGEYSAGTIKLLLIRPWSRAKILLSKYIALALFAVFFFAAQFLWTYLWDGLFFGFSAGTVSEAISGSSDKSIWNYMLSMYGLEYLSMLLTTVTISFLLSTVFRSGGLAIGLSILLMFMSGTLSNVFSLINKPWVDYLWFMQSNLSQYLQPGDRDHTIGFSLGVLAVYYLIFIGITWTVFTKRDVAS